MTFFIPNSRSVFYIHNFTPKKAVSAGTFHFLCAFLFSLKKSAKQHGFTIKACPLLEVSHFSQVFCQSLVSKRIPSCHKFQIFFFGDFRTQLNRQISKLKLEKKGRKCSILFFRYSRSIPHYGPLSYPIFYVFKKSSIWEIYGKKDIRYVPFLMFFDFVECLSKQYC